MTHETTRADSTPAALGMLGISHPRPVLCDNCGAHPGTTPVRAYREERVNVCDFKKVTLAECWCDECVRDYPAEFTEE